MSFPARVAFAVLAAFALALAGCSVPEVPDVTYFRLPPPAPLPHAQQPLSLLPIEVETFNAEGVYSEQALIYSLEPTGNALRTYHYQLWSDPPTHALEARLVDALRESGIAQLVTDRLPASTPALRIRGTIRRFDRISDGSGAFKAVVSLEIRVEQDEGEPIIEKEYRAEEAAADGTLNATVVAFGKAVDRVFGAFYDDLVALRGDSHAR
jgi:cholesterol transport system auxiliary component